MVENDCRCTHRNIFRNKKVKKSLGKRLTFSSGESPIDSTS